MKPIASLSLDLDNKWSYMKTHGDAGWDKYPTYLDLVVPRFLKVLHERDMKMTVFIVGQDAAREENFEALASISAAGHEIGNQRPKNISNESPGNVRSAFEAPDLVSVICC